VYFLQGGKQPPDGVPVGYFCNYKKMIAKDAGGFVIKYLKTTEVLCPISAKE
jgi:hypothetical protein